jgi:hypothetical protein
MKYEMNADAMSDEQYCRPLFITNGTCPPKDLANAIRQA